MSEMFVAGATYAAVLVASNGPVGVDSNGSGQAEATRRHNTGWKMVCELVQER